MSKYFSFALKAISFRKVIHLICYCCYHDTLLGFLLIYNNLNYQSETGLKICENLRFVVKGESSIGAYFVSIDPINKQINREITFYEVLSF